MLAFYAYIILGIDYDSFSELGGTEHFQRALNVVNNAQQSGRGGWQQNESVRNRYWLSENFINSQMEEIRKGLYTYHRLSLDVFDASPDDARQNILNVLKDVKNVWNIYPNSILVISFLDAKSAELVNVFSDGNMQVRREAYDILSTIDPSKQEDYEQIVNN